MITKGIGIDIVETERFLPFEKERENRFLIDNFSKRELDYCFAFCDSSIHLAGTFSAKEAVWKALSNKNILQSTIEIRRDTNGKPEVWIKNRRQKSILVSISHTTKIATAIAIKQ
jgi:phosphopantetheine--protein transferase-like protein